MCSTAVFARFSLCTDAIRVVNTNFPTLLVIPLYIAERQKRLRLRAATESG
jgi:hypothetical protein